MKNRGNIIFLVIIIVATLVVVGGSFTMASFKSKLLPIVFGSGIAVLAIVQLVRETTRKDPPAKVVTDEDEEEMSEEEGAIDWRGFQKSAIWVLAFVGVTYLVSMLVAIPLFVLFYMKHLGTGWRTSIISAAATTAAIYIVFEMVLNVELYRGLVMRF
ncbi:MAG: tripartite tricarboxylate transporter TctB family protein [Chloroflexi bacterium]|nr:tripartite tricarboxylate transporter TctB family protein [Chloroflexota bacterium]